MFVLCISAKRMTAPTAPLALTLYCQALNRGERPSIWQGNPHKADWQLITPDDLCDLAEVAFAQSASLLPSPTVALWFSLEVA